MKTIYFKCKLLTDVVLNSSLATEGNMQSLDYIPGSNFLGIVAKEYESLDNENKAFDIFHSGKVSFGDALISIDNSVSYKMPYSFFLDKLNNDITKDKVWVHHGIADFEAVKDEKEEKKLQLKQHRTGYLNVNKIYIPKVNKEFNLKSAYNKEERRSEEGKMFGFEAIKKGQEFIFSVIFEDEQYIETVTNALIGEKHIGKSKTAQYGSVKIDKIDKSEVFESQPTKEKELVIYAESNLCFLNEGQPTFQPDAKDFGVNGKIIWEDSQIRTYSYSPWNTKRNSSDTQRDVILKGSVIVIETKNVDFNKLPKQVGEYNAEGLGRIIYNSDFLEFDKDGIWNFKLEEISEQKKEAQTPISINSPLGKFLQQKEKDVNNELKIGKKILEIFDSENGKILLSDKITKSQWGAIRSKATLAKSVSDLILELEDFLSHGVADEKIWGKRKGERRKSLLKIIEENKELGTTFVAKFASEIAKKNDEKQAQDGK